MEKLKWQFCESLIDDLINKRAQIVQTHQGSHVNTILIRFPKDNWQKISDGRKFEFKEYQQNSRHFDGEMIVTTWRNGHLREVKRRTREEHHETSYYARKADRLRSKS